VVLGIVVTRAMPGLTFPAIGLLALTGVGPCFVVDEPVAGRVVNLRLADNIPADSSLAGYAAPGGASARRAGSADALLRQQRRVGPHDAAIELELLPGQRVELGRA
jgi:hypothetical protein